MTLAFVDACVLVTALPRSILYLASALETTDYQLVYSPYVEDEAVKNQRPGTVPVTTLRMALDWIVVPDVSDLVSFDFYDTDPKDRPVLAAAIANQAPFIITANIKDFGPADLKTYQMTVVHPGLWLAHRLTADDYVETLTRLCAKRQRDPKTPLATHIQEVAVELPDLFERYRNVFGPIAPSMQPQLHQTYRGTSCVACGQPISDSGPLCPLHRIQPTVP